jgi:RNA polymerase sigma-70 factor (ECF subfamily)
VRGVPVDIEEAYDVSGDDEVDRLEQRSELDAVRAALARLPVELRDVMSAVVLEEKSYRETADMLHIPIGTVMSRMSRARQFIESHVHRNPEARRSA